VIDDRYGENRMKKLTLLWIALSVAGGSSVAWAADPAATPGESSAVSSYSAPTETHHKKPKKKKMGASEPMAAPQGASQ
jgi:hypothetical protein